MTNTFYNASGNPGTGSEGLSALIRGEFLAIQTAFDVMPRISTTGGFDTVFNQLGNFTFTLPAAPGTLATAADVVADVAVETTRAMVAEGAEATARAAADTTNANAISAETARATAAEANNIGRNRLHNGGFRINQRAYVSGVALAINGYAHDRWKAGSGGCTYTFTQTQPDTTITITAGTLVQAIRAADVEGGSYVLSWAGTAHGRINAGSFAASPVTVSGLSAATQITVEFQTGTLGQVQFEAGTVASAFERRTNATELAACQNYYQIVAGQFQNTTAGAADVTFTCWFKAAMRSTPTFVMLTNACTNVTSPSLSTYSLDLTGAALISGTAGGGGYTFNVQFSASSEL